MKYPYGVICRKCKRDVAKVPGLRWFWPEGACGDCMAQMFPEWWSRTWGNPYYLMRTAEHPKED